MHRKPLTILACALLLVVGVATTLQAEMSADEIKEGTPVRIIPDEEVLEVRMDRIAVGAEGWCGYAGGYAGRDGAIVEVYDDRNALVEFTEYVSIAFPWDALLVRI